MTDITEYDKNPSPDRNGYPAVDVGKFESGRALALGRIGRMERGVKVDSRISF